MAERFSHPSTTISAPFTPTAHVPENDQQCDML